ncbi:MAG TPA: phosphomannomutase/phosphoglucomutase [Rickettsiales bacterium]|nr:phosphomannomutase/phosphoglucomutase [Rickettsiales bacterium]
MKHNFDSSIIRAYDIRGIYDETLYDQDAYFVGRAFAAFMCKNNKKKISVACDGRLSSPALKSQLIKGLLESGLEVVDIGLGPTPMLYFSVYHLVCDAGIMVTGSHNPGHHNGFKIILKERPFFGNDILGLQKIAANGDFIEGNGVLKKIDIEDEYVSNIISDCILDDANMKIVWDAGNGAAGSVIKKISSKINAKHFLLFAEIDGNFPNHHPDPTVEKNLQDLKQKILQEKCDIGIAFDGDGDRIGVMDDEGEILWGDQLLIFYAREVLQKNKGATIIADVKASKVLFDEIAKAGGNALMWKTGHSFVKAKMKETHAPLAGEMSGHIFFADKYLSKQNHGYDDALYAAIRIINILAKSSGKKLSDLRKSLPKTFSTAEIRIEVDEKEKFIIADKIKQNVKNQELNINDVDGVRVTTSDGWWLLRASNTQAVLVARCEANSFENLEKLKENLRKNLELLNVKIPQELL